MAGFRAASMRVQGRGGVCDEPAIRISLAGPCDYLYFVFCHSCRGRNGVAFGGHTILSFVQRARRLAQSASEDSANRPDGNRAGRVRVPLGSMRSRRRFAECTNGTNAPGRVGRIHAGSACSAAGSARSAAGRRAQRRVGALSGGSARSAAGSARSGPLLEHREEPMVATGRAAGWARCPRRTPSSTTWYASK